MNRTALLAMMLGGLATPQEALSAPMSRVVDSPKIARSTMRSRPSKIRFPSPQCPDCKRNVSPRGCLNRNCKRFVGGKNA